jgi:hypothetical protein
MKLCYKDLEVPMDKILKVLKSKVVILLDQLKLSKRISFPKINKP